RVDPLVEQLTAPRLRGVHAPLPLVARPTSMAIATAKEKKVAQFARGSEVVGAPDRRMVAVIEADMDASSAGQRRRENPFRVMAGHAHRLLAEHVLPCLQRSHRDGRE